MRSVWKFEIIVLMVAIAAIIGFALSGCAAPTNSVIVKCLPLKAWSNADQDQLQKEYDALPANAQMREAFKDYMAMRDETRACENGGVK